MRYYALIILLIVGCTSVNIEQPAIYENQQPTANNVKQSDTGFQEMASREYLKLLIEDFLYQDTNDCHQKRFINGSYIPTVRDLIISCYRNENMNCDDGTSYCDFMESFTEQYLSSNIDFANIYFHMDISDDVRYEYKKGYICEPVVTYKQPLLLDTKGNSMLLTLTIAEKECTVDDMEPMIREPSQDDEFANRAIAENDSSLCEEIESLSKRDTCYMNFVKNKDFSVCSRINDETLRLNCENLEKLQP